MQLQLHYANYNYRHYSYNYSCTTPHYIQQLCINHCSHFKKHNSNHLSVHQWIRSAIRHSQHPTSPIGFLFLKLPPPPCTVLLVKLSQDRFSGTRVCILNLSCSIRQPAYMQDIVAVHLAMGPQQWTIDEQRQSTCINVAKPEAKSKRCSWSFVNNTPNGETRYGLSLDLSHYSGFKYTEIWMTRTHNIGDDLQVQPSQQWLFAASFAQIEQCKYLSVVSRCMYINMWL